MYKRAGFFLQDKKQIAGKYSTKTTLHNGVSDDSFPTNNNDQAKRIRLDKSDQPPLKVRLSSLRLSQRTRKESLERDGERI